MTDYHSKKVRELTAALEQAEKERDEAQESYEQCSKEYSRLHNMDRGDWLVYKHEYDEWQQAKADRDRLAAALEQIRDYETALEGGTWEEDLDAVQTIAREALNPGNGE